MLNCGISNYNKFRLQRLARLHIAKQTLQSSARSLEGATYYTNNRLAFAWLSILFLVILVPFNYSIITVYTIHTPNVRQLNEVLHSAYCST